MSTILKDQRRVLFVTSMTEFGERYSYYIVQSLLIFYLINQFHLTQEKGANLVGTVISMVYISAIVGGYIADKFIGYYRAAFLGSLLMMGGSLILATASTENIMFLGLCLISVSTGLIKSNMSSFIGRFYDRSGLTHGHRDFGFNIFYVGINLGSFFALVFASYLNNKYGFSVPFYSSMLVTGVIIAILIYGFFRLRHYIVDVELSASIVLQTLGLIIAYIAIVYVILKQPIIANLSIAIATIFCIAILIRSCKNHAAKKVIVVGLFFLLSIIYWSLYFQIFISLLLFVDYAVNHQLGFLTLNTSQFLGIEAIGVLVFGVVMGKVWLSFAKQGRQVQDIDKFNLSFITIVAVFAILYLGILIGSPVVKVTAIAFVFAYILLAISELCLSAIGLSMITKLAPKGFVSLYMGIWLVTLGIGGKLGGFLSQFIYIPENNVALAKSNMSHGLLMFIAIAIGASILCLILRQFIIRHSHSADDAH